MWSESLAAIERSVVDQIGTRRLYAADRSIHGRTKLSSDDDRRDDQRCRRQIAGTQKIIVPIMGEGIRSAKVVALLKKPGDPIELDDALCEVETDKAVYPIESSFAGTMGEWKTKVDDTVEIGQELGTILTEGEDWDEQFEAAAEASRAAGKQPTASDARRSSKTADLPRAGAFRHDHAQARPRRSGESADRCALGSDPQGARRGQEKRRQERALSFRHDRLGGR